MELHVQVEKPSHIVRKLHIRVPAREVSTRFQRGLIEVQKTANLKGFRKGMAPISIIRQYFGDDVRHRVFHHLIDESFRAALLQEKIPAVGLPQIEEDPGHRTGEGEHDHALSEDKDLSYTATVEILPEIEVKDYEGLSLERPASEVTNEDIENVLKGLQDQHSELVPVSGGLVAVDGSASSRPARKGDHVDIVFKGVLLNGLEREEKPGMSGSRVLELGSNELIPGFEDHLVGMRAGETKTFGIAFPEDFYEKDMAGRSSEFTVTMNEVKEKKVPPLDDELARQMGYEDLADLRVKARTHLTRQKTDQAEAQLQNDLVRQLIEKIPFEVPRALVENQTRALVQDWANELKKQGMNDQLIQQAILPELPNLGKRAETQVRATLILEAIAKKEGIEISPGEVEQEIARSAATLKMDEGKVRDFYAKDPGRKGDLSFRLRQERTMRFLLDKARIKSA